MKERKTHKHTLSIVKNNNIIFLVIYLMQWMDRCSILSINYHQTYFFCCSSFFSGLKFEYNIGNCYWFSLFSRIKCTEYQLIYVDSRPKCFQKRLIIYQHVHYSQVSYNSTCLCFIARSNCVLYAKYIFWTRIIVFIIFFFSSHELCFL